MVVVDHGAPVGAAVSNGTTSHHFTVKRADALLRQPALLPSVPVVMLLTSPFLLSSRRQLFGTVQTNGFAAHHWVTRTEFPSASFLFPLFAHFVSVPQLFVMAPRENTRPSLSRRILQALEYVTSGSSASQARLWNLEGSSEKTHESSSIVAFGLYYPSRFCAGLRHPATRKR